jgi:hypothetical protein
MAEQPKKAINVLSHVGYGRKPSQGKTIKSFRLPAVIFGSKTQGKKKPRSFHHRTKPISTSTTSLWLSKCLVFVRGMYLLPFHREIMGVGS